MKRLRERLASEAGYSLPELLVTMTLGVVILGSATMIMIGAARHNTQVASRTDSTARGRVALDRMEQLLRSQVCSTASSFPVTAASGSSVTFYSDLTDGVTPITRHTLNFDSATRTLSDTAIVGSTGSPQTFDATMAKTTQLATDVVLGSASTVFSYYGYPDTAPASGTLEPNVPLASGTGGLSAADVGRIARIDINFAAQGERTDTRAVRAEMSDQVFVRLSDPNSATTFNPSCT